MNKKGFTLIELLAVILVLGIIAAIAVVLTINIIEDAKESAAKTSTENYLNSVRQYLTLQELGVRDEKLLDNNIYYVVSGSDFDEDGTIQDNLEDFINIDGTKPSDGYIKIKFGEIEEATIIYNGYEITCIKDEKCISNGKYSSGKIKRIELSTTNIDYENLNAGDTVQINASIYPSTVEDKTLTWVSSDSSVATVDQNGLVTIVSKGNCKITATSNNNKQSTLYLYMVNPSQPEIADVTLSGIIMEEDGTYYKEFITINYDATREDVDNYYSLDGVNWLPYTEQFRTNNKTITAKSVVRETNYETTSTKTMTTQSKILDSTAFDDDETTYNNLTWNGSSYDNPRTIEVVPELRGREIILTTYSQHGYGFIKFFDSNNVELEKYTIPAGTKTKTYAVPQNASYMIMNKTAIELFYLYEIYPSTRPVITELYAVHPTISASGVEASYRLVDIKYHDSYPVKQYKIDDGEIMTYSNPVKVYSNTTLTAFSKNVSGKVSMSEEFKSLRQSLDFKKEGFDNDETTYEDLTWNGNSYDNPRRANIDISLHGREISLKTYSQHEYGFIKFYDSNDQELKSYKIPAGTVTKDYEVPENSSYMIINKTDIQFLYLYEINVK